MDDLQRYVDFLYEGQQGYVYSPVKRPDKWDQQFFAWPTERTKLLDHIQVNGAENDVYICPAVFAKKDASKPSFKSTRVIWVEFDGKESINFKDIPPPNVIVQTSSSTHLHCYWKTEQLESTDVVEDVNRRLTYHFVADSTGWDAVQLLRPPTTQNFKYDNKPSVILAHFSKDQKFKLKDFDDAPEIEKPAISLVEANLVDPQKVLKQLPLVRSVRNRIETENVEEGQRSQFLYKLAHELAEVGANHSQIASVIWYVDERIGKFRDRSDRMVRISELASLALHSVDSLDEISLYSVNDVLNHTEDLEWIWNRWLHNQGLMIVTGAPGVGKTQFCLQLMNAFSAGATFITSELTQKTALFMSLELDVRELKFILRMQYGSDLWVSSDNSRIMDEPGQFIQYEELFDTYHPGIVIIDSLFELTDGELLDGPKVLEVTRWLKRMRRKYGMAMVIIHHNRKSSSTNKKPNSLDDIFGSVILNKEIDTAICLWQEEEADYIDLYPVKSRYSQREDLKIERDEHLTFSIHEETDSGGDTGEIRSLGDASKLLGFE